MEGLLQALGPADEGLVGTGVVEDPELPGPGLLDGRWVGEDVPDLG